MKQVKLLHNRNAGDEGHSKSELIHLIETAGYLCDYSDLKQAGWHQISEHTDLIVIAGGDGTVRKVIRKLLKRRLIDKEFPLAVLPLGTANNLAKTLSVNKDFTQVVKGWNRSHKQAFDIGRIYGTKERFFLESMGYGIFPALMKEMEKLSGKEWSTPEEELEAAIKLLKDIASTFVPVYCKLKINGRDYSGSYLLAEIMNIRSIGPNLVLAPDAEPGDGSFEVVLVTDEQRNELLSYLDNKLMGHETPINLRIVKGSEIEMSWDRKNCHVDDKLLKIGKSSEVKVEAARHKFTFL